MENKILYQNTRPSTPSISGRSSTSPSKETQLIRKIEKGCLKTEKKEIISKIKMYQLYIRLSYN